MARYYVIQPTQPLFPPSTHYRHPRPIRAIRPRAMLSNYQYTLYRLRKDVRCLAKAAIVAATGNRYAEATWTREESSGMQKNVFKWHVEMEGWPAWATFEAPGHISSVRKLQHIADGLRTGAIWFRRLSFAEVSRRERELGLTRIEARRARNDATLVRPLRPLATRSALLRKWTGIHTRETVSEQEDIEAAIWPEEPARARDTVDEIEQWED